MAATSSVSFRSKQEQPSSLSPMDVGMRWQGEFEKQKLGHRRIDRQGEVSYKRIPTDALMSSIQLGIANSIGSLASKPRRDLLLQDFDVLETVSFPPGGSLTTPSHGYGEFKFLTYAPVAFRTFRALFSIKAADFLHSICTEPLKELSNPGASGSIFYVSLDDRFIIKTVQRKEAEFLRQLLPGYYMNFNQNPQTLLPKFFGLFCYQTLSKNIRLLVMNNLLPQSIALHEKYDVKGSTYKRMASKHERSKCSPTLKDLDLLEEHPKGLILDSLSYEAIMKTISRDCLVLESFKIMDYSLLIGIHNLSCADENNIVEEPDGAAPSTSSTEETKKLMRPKDKYLDFDSNSNGVYRARNHKGDHLLFFLGIIDILQNYKLFKKLEHAWKSIILDSDISVCNPTFYAQRFTSFVKSELFCRAASSASLRSPTKRRSIQEKEEKEASGDYVSRNDAERSSVVRAQRRRSYGRSDPLPIEKPREKKVERLFAPDPGPGQKSGEALLSNHSTSEEETITHL